jgi:hypothetical protein
VKIVQASYWYSVRYIWLSTIRSRLQLSSGIMSMGLGSVDGTSLIFGSSPHPSKRRYRLGESRPSGCFGHRTGSIRGGPMAMQSIA